MDPSITQREIDMMQSIDIMCKTCGNAFTPYSDLEREMRLCDNCQLPIHQKINWKGNKQLQHPNTSADQVSEYIATMMRRGYVTYQDRPLMAWDLERIHYRQDRKTNYREPREPDGEDFCGKEAQNFEAEQMAKIQREIK